MPFTDEYRKLMLIGRGSFAAVYKVRHNKLGYIRAIKISNEMVDSENDPSYRSFLNECRLLLKIGNGSHPNIVHIYQPRLINNHALVEMDYVDGQTLTEYIRENRFVPMQEFWKFAEGISGAVGYCHADLYKFLMDADEDELEPDPEDGSKYLISPEKEKQLQAKYCVNHNDLHSNNIIRRNYDGMYILLDFGLAIQGSHCVKSSSRADGAYEYSSPEKLDGKEITAASDVYSLGILLYEMLAGQVPFVMGRGNGMADVSRIYDRQLHESPGPIEPLRRKVFEEKYPGQLYSKDYPAGLEDIIMKCLKKNPDERYANAKEVNLAISRIKSENIKDASEFQTLIDNLKTENAYLRSRLETLEANKESKHSLCEIVKQSETSMPWLRKINEDDLNLVTEASRSWYIENCFIIPRGSHIPTKKELESLNSLLHEPTRVWDSSTSADTTDEKFFIAIK